jgi:hypothetical protein
MGWDHEEEGELGAGCKYVEDCFLGVWECLIFTAKKPHEVHTASDGGFTGGNTVPHKVRREK